MNDFQAFKNDFLNKSRHHSKLVKFIYPELKKIKTRQNSIKNILRKI